MPLALSEAIRLGSMWAPQGFDVLINDEGATCALGAAMQACGVAIESVVSLQGAYGQWPWTQDGFRPCLHPDCRVGLISTADLITHLNDRHKWTREQIADWVQTIEPSAISDADGSRTEPVGVTG